MTSTTTMTTVTSAGSSMTRTRTVDIGEIALLPQPPSKKWVTFDDIKNDAMESGKLDNVLEDERSDEQQQERRNSVTGSSILGSSVSSSGSFENSFSKTPLDFTQSLNYQLGSTSSARKSPLTGLRKSEGMMSSSGEIQFLGTESETQVSHQSIKENID